MPPLDPPGAGEGSLLSAVDAVKTTTARWRFCSVLLRPCCCCWCGPTPWRWPLANEELDLAAASSPTPSTRAELQLNIVDGKMRYLFMQGMDYRYVTLLLLLLVRTDAMEAMCRCPPAVEELPPPSMHQICNANGARRCSVCFLLPFPDAADLTPWTDKAMCLTPSDACVLCSHLLDMGICCWERRTTMRVANPTPAGGSAPCSSDPAAAATASADRRHGGRVQMPPRSWNSLQQQHGFGTAKDKGFISLCQCQARCAAAVPQRFSIGYKITMD